MAMNINLGYRLLAVTVALVAGALAVGCSQYKKHFGGKSGDYEQAASYKPLSKANTVDSLQANSRYAIPELPQDGAVEDVDIVPPDYK